MTVETAVENQAVTIKVSVDEDIRRIVIAGPTFSTLREEIFKRFNFKPNARIVIKYKDDDGDLITVGDDAELKDAINIATHQGVLRLFVSVVRKPPVANAATAPAPNTNAPPAVAPAPAPAPAPAVPTAFPAPAVGVSTPTPADAFASAPPAVLAPNAVQPYVPPFRTLDRQAKIERMQQWREHKKQIRELKEQKKAAKQVFKANVKCAKAAAKGQKQLARFVKEVGLEDGKELAPGSRFIKTWRFRNESNEAWPEGCQLLFISIKGGDQMGGPASIPVPVTALPGQEVDVSVELTAPLQPGRYAGHYRLSTPDGRKFGDRVRNLIYVVDPSSTSASSSEDEKNFATYAALLAQLEQMGFANKHKNGKLLKRYDGNINKAVKKLVKKQRKAANKKI